MRLIRLGIAPAMLTALAGVATAAWAQDPPPAPPPAIMIPPPPPPSPNMTPMPAPAQPTIATPAAPPAPPAPPAPYRRCSQVGRGLASVGTCALRVIPGRTAQLQIRIERNLPARPAAIILIWREREGSGGVLYRITGSALGANPGQSAGTILTVPVSDRYCAPNNRPFEVELELADGRNIGMIGRASFPCAG